MRFQKRQKKTAPGSYQVLSLTRAKSYLYVTTTDQDEVIQDLINGSVAYLEAALDFAIDTDQPIYQYMDQWPTGEHIPIWHRYVTDAVAVEYWDGNSWETVSTSIYRYDPAGPVPRVILRDGYDWPGAIAADLNSVRVTFTPDTTMGFYNELKAAVMTLVAARYENREMSEIAPTVMAFITKYKMPA